ncbi:MULTISPECIES: lipid kinase [unclassified Synechocystis]|uniref:lipid kinase n=1 Tax=unclassified Synechocystis TaxID=2640012 RepID=UPI000426BB76|nr:MULTISPECIES: lipid kinase [unclassified Synechocystis]AIE74449.1 Transcription regulator [contains diacylglycerol kinase catalytic domain] [Synechocystis sp. PCC 6714]MCT0254784.1 lipid kinase [Synechocystis sp. CS-94]
MGKRALLIINRHSRRGQIGFAQAVDYLDNLGFELVTVPAQYSQSLENYVDRHINSVDMVIAGGGDGTLNAVVNSLAKHQVPLGILPMGTANDLARTLNLPNDIVKACDVINQGHRKQIDLGCVNGQYFLNVSSLGLSVEITTKLTRGAKRRWGIFAYGLTALQVLRQARLFHATITHNGRSEVVKTLQIAVGNGRYYGGGMAIAKDATIDDNRLDLYSLEIRHWWQIFDLLIHLPAGEQHLLPWVRTVSAESIEIKTSRPRKINTDGEIIVETPARFTVIPQALSVFVPLQR